MVPVEGGGNVFPVVVAFLEILAFQEKLNGLFGSSHAAQFVPIHMLRVRYLRVGARLFQSFLKLSLILIAMRQKMMRGEIIRRNRQRTLVVRSGRRHTSLPVAKRRGLFGMAAEQEQLHIVRIRSQRVVNLP